MADIKWIKITTDIFDDDKILLIETLPEADAIIVIWFKLLCLAGKQNNSGVFMMNDKIAYTDKMLATIFRRKEATVQLALETFEKFGMIEVIDGVITIPKWAKHQNIDQLEQRKEYMREYMQNYRQKQKLLASSDADTKGGKAYSKTNSKANVSVLEKNREDKNRIDNNKYFVPPSIEEVTAYCNERNNNIDPQAFIDFYQTRGWTVGKGVKMKDWRAAVRTWENRRKESKPKLPTYEPTEQEKNDLKVLFGDDIEW